MDEVGQYITELAALWGANTIVLEMPWEQFSGFDDPDMIREINLTTSLFLATRPTGIKLGLVGVANQGFTTRPESMKACYPLPGNHFGEFNADYPQVRVFNMNVFFLYFFLFCFSGQGVQYESEDVRGQSKKKLPSFARFR